MESDDIKCLVFIKNECDLWYRKLGHISVKQISKLSFENLVHGLVRLKFEKSNPCSACILGKQVKSLFKPIKHVSTNRALQLLHIDIFGPTWNLSLGGKKYCLVIVDGYIKFT